MHTFVYALSGQISKFLESTYALFSIKIYTEHNAKKSGLKTTIQKQITYIGR